MNRIAILTHYYGEYNFGALLQAYALQKYIDSMGLECKQLSYMGRQPWVDVYHKESYSGIASILERIKKRYVWEKWKERRYVFDSFRDMIPHTKAYSDNDIDDAIGEADVFVTGSDQVWNPIELVNHFHWTLDFVPDNTLKVAYAASISKKSLSDEDKKLLLPEISRIDYVSVREKSAKDLLSLVLPNKKVEVMPDPVILLSTEEWNKIVDDKYVSKFGKYIFCYFLGNDREQRKKVTAIARTLKMPIVTFPFMQQSFEYADVLFGNIKLYDAGPAEFVSLISKAELVFTDSFHATVFAAMFHKKFRVFKRFADSDKESMNSRIYDLIENYHLQNALVQEVKDIQAEICMQKLDFSYRDAFVENERKRAFMYLQNVLIGERNELCT